MIMEYMDEKHFNMSTNDRIAPIDDMDGNAPPHSGRRSIMDFGNIR